MKTNYVQLEHLVVVGHRWLVFPFARGVGGLVVGLWGGGGGSRLGGYSRGRCTPASSAKIYRESEGVKEIRQ